MNKNKQETFDFIINELNKFFELKKKNKIAAIDFIFDGLPESYSYATRIRNKDGYNKTSQYGPLTIEIDSFIYFLIAEMKINEKDIFNKFPVAILISLEWNHIKEILEKVATNNNLTIPQFK